MEVSDWLVHCHRVLIIIVLSVIFSHSNNIYILYIASGSILQYIGSETVLLLGGTQVLETHSFEMHHLIIPHHVH